MPDPNASITVDSPKPQPITDATYPVAEPTNDRMVDVFSPEGIKGQIPASKADEAFGRRGFKFATQDDSGNWKPEHPVSVSMKDSSGNYSQGGYVPASKAGLGLKQGRLQLGPPEQQ